MINQNEQPMSLLVSNLWQLPSGDFKLPYSNKAVLIKNITESNITVEVLLKDAEEYVSTVLYPGWNPELIVGIKNVPSGSLQAGN